MGNSNISIRLAGKKSVENNIVRVLKTYTPNNSMTSLKIYGLFAVLHKKAQLFDL